MIFEIFKCQTIKYFTACTRMYYKFAES